MPQKFSPSITTATYPSTSAVFIPVLVSTNCLGASSTTKVPPASLFIFLFLFWISVDFGGRDEWKKSEMEEGDRGAALAAFAASRALEMAVECGGSGAGKCVVRFEARGAPAWRGDDIDGWRSSLRDGPSVARWVSSPINLTLTCV